MAFQASWDLYDRSFPPLGFYSVVVYIELLGREERGGVVGGLERGGGEAGLVACVCVCVCLSKDVSVCTCVLSLQVFGSS